MALHEARLLRIAGEDSEAALFVRAMLEAARVAGDDLTPDGYKQAREQLRATGVELPSFAAILKHFGSWRRAKEAISLSDVEPADRIAARFRARRVGKMHSFTEDALRDALAACSAFLGRPPLVAEYVAWRARELELAHERGDRGYALPSDGAFRGRYKTWTATLVHFGYSPAFGAPGGVGGLLGMCVLAYVLHRKGSDDEHGERDRTVDSIAR